MTTTAKKPEPTLDPHREVDSQGVKDVYVFELPVRLVHWIVFLAVFVLSVTGYWIAGAEMPRTPLGQSDMMALRAVHLAAEWVFIAAIVVRLIWAFTGNIWASWREWVPSNRRRLREIVE